TDIDLKLELPPDLEEQPPQGNMIGHFRCIAHRSEEYTVRLAEPLHSVRSHHAAVLQVVVTSVTKLLIFKLQSAVYISDRIQHPQGSGHHFLPDSVPGYYSKLYVLHMHPPKFSYFLRPETDPSPVSIRHQCHDYATCKRRPHARPQEILLRHPPGAVGDNVRHRLHDKQEPEEQRDRRSHGHDSRVQTGLCRNADEDRQYRYDRRRDIRHAEVIDLGQNDHDRYRKPRVAEHLYESLWRQQRSEMGDFAGFDQ